MTAAVAAPGAPIGKLGRAVGICGRVSLPGMGMYAQDVEPPPDGARTFIFPTFQA
ncbi:hypothetical protein Skr01_47040 [Sphaerisporangium krabiense]|nr:hypothetical protein Skr01_47040 [Sphaerisporangium krabiense]